MSHVPRNYPVAKLKGRGLAEMTDPSSIDPKVLADVLEHISSLDEGVLDFLSVQLVWKRAQRVVLIFVSRGQFK